MSEELPPVYLISGDSFLIEEKSKQITAGFKKRYSGEIFEQTFYLSETDFSGLLVQARTLPFLVSAQIFYVRDLPKFKKQDADIFKAYLENPPKTTLLILQTDSLEKLEELVQLAGHYGKIERLSSKEKKSAFQLFVKQKLKTAEKTMQGPALRRLEEAIGEMPSFLDSMLERLIAYAGKSSEITENMVLTFEENWTETSVFRLTDAVTSRKPDVALQVLQDLVGDEREIPGLLGILHWQIRRLWLGAVLKESGEPPSLILKKCRVSEKQAPFFTRQLSRLSAKDLEKSLDGLFHLDWRLKTGRISGLSALEMWVLETAS